jgi:hypothetical protein
MARRSRYDGQSQDLSELNEFKSGYDVRAQKTIDRLLKKKEAYSEALFKLSGTTQRGLMHEELIDCGTALKKKAIETSCGAFANPHRSGFGMATSIEEVVRVPAAD